MMKVAAILLALMRCGVAIAETTVNGVRASNVLGGAEQHASFSFVRPGLTQTSYAFNGPSSHQSFSSSIGNPHLAQRVLPNVANALAYRNPGLGYFPTAPVSTGYANSPYIHPAGLPVNPSPLPAAPAAFSYQQQAPIDPAMALAYLQLYQRYQQQTRTQSAQTPVQQAYNPEIAAYQTQLGQLFALRHQQQQQQALLQAENQQNHGQTPDPQHIPVHETSQEISEQHQAQQSGQNLLGVAYSSAPSVAHVKVTGNGYKFNF